MIKKVYSKKDFALKNKSLVNDKFIQGAIFAFENNKDVNKLVWKQLFPPHEKPFMNKNEDELE